MYQPYMNQVQLRISHLTSDELKELLNDDEKLEEKVNEAASSLESEKDEILAENRKIAEGNLEKEPEIIELKARLNELTEEGKTLCDSVQSKLNEIKSKSGNMSQDTALALLQTAAAESEEESEKLVKDFLEKDLELESFLEQFLTTRKTMHLRKIKVDKMSELIKNPNSIKGFFSNPISGNANLPYPIGPPGGSVPYPIGPLAMPMPMPGLPRPY